MSADVQDTDKFANLAEKICRRLSIRYRLISKIHGGGHSTFRVDDSCVIKMYTYSGSLEYTMRKVCAGTWRRAVARSKASSKPVAFEHHIA